MIGKISTSVLNHQPRTKMHIYPSYSSLMQPMPQTVEISCSNKAKKNDAAKGDSHQLVAVNRKLDG